MDEENSEDKGFKLSRYNSAADQLQRIGQLWKEANTCAKQGSHHEWNRILDTIWRELAGDLPDNSPQEKNFNDLVQEILRVLPLSNTSTKSFNKIKENSHSKVSKEYIILMKKDIFLRRLQNNLGKGSAYKDEFEDDFE